MSELLPGLILIKTMGAKQSTGTNSPRVRTYSSSGSGSHNGAGPHLAIGGSHNAGNRARARSLGSFTANPTAGLHIPVSNGSGAVGGTPDSDSSSPEESGPSHLPHGLRSLTHSLPVHLFALPGKLNKQPFVTHCVECHSGTKSTFYILKKDRTG